METIILADSQIDDNYKELSGVSNIFLAPEYYSGNDAHTKVDIWSIGAILYLLVTGGINNESEGSYVESFNFRDRIWR